MNTAYDVKINGENSDLRRNFNECQAFEIFLGLNYFVRLVVQDFKIRCSGFVKNAIHTHL